MDAVILKQNEPLLVGFCVCRSCFMKLELQHKPHTANASEQTCAVKGCENPSAYIAAVSPFEYKQ